MNIKINVIIEQIWIAVRHFRLNSGPAEIRLTLSENCENISTIFSSKHYHEVEHRLRMESFYIFVSKVTSVNPNLLIEKQTLCSKSCDN